MQYLTLFAVLLLAFGQLNAIEISSSCLHGQTDANTCCKGVPPSQDVLLRNPADCNTYYQCVHEVPMLRPCPANLHWSVAANRCEWPELAGCEGSTAPETTKAPKPTTHKPDPTTPSGGNTCEGTAPEPPSNECVIGHTSAEECCKGVPYWVDLLLPNPEDCGSYLQCVHEKPMVRPCPEGLHWSIANNRCEWPNIAKCDESGSGGGSGGEGGEGIPSEGCIIGDITAEECCRGVPYWIDVLLKNPKDCTTYYQCVHEKPMIRPCPAGLHWSVAANRCEWQDIANCQ